MAIDLSAVQPGPCMIAAETTYGTAPAGFTADARGFFTIASVNPFQADLQYQEFIPHTLDFLLSKDIPTFKLARVRCRTMLMGGTAANSPPRFSPLWQCSGAHQAVIPGTPGSVRWTQATRAQLVGSSFAFEIPGHTDSWVHEVNGLLGNSTIVGSAREGLFCDFDGTGLYQVPQAGSLTDVFTGTWSAGTNNANKFILSSSNRVIINNGGSDYIGVVKRVEFNLGAEPSPITDVNSGATYGVFSIEHVRFRPTLTIDFGLDTDNSANVDLLDLYNDADDGTLHDVAWAYTDLASRVLTFTFPTSQVRTVSYAEDENVRVSRVVYKLQGSVPWQIDQS